MPQIQSATAEPVLLYYQWNGNNLLFFRLKSWEKISCYRVDDIETFWFSGLVNQILLSWFGDLGVIKNNPV